MDISLCICDLIPRLNLATKLHVIMHPKEFPKPSNTGHLAVQSLENSELTLRRKFEDARSLVETYLEPENPVLLLFPDEKAPRLDQVIESQSLAGNPKTLLVVDGTWKQAERIYQKDLQPLHKFAVRFPNISKTLHSALWKEPQEGGMATMEAILIAMEYCEPHADLQPLWDLLKIRAQRIKWVREWIAEHEVINGIPELAKIRKQQKIIAGN